MSLVGQGALHSFLFSSHNGGAVPALEGLLLKPFAETTESLGFITPH